jgi:hypothetical protein|uniref:Uncharacterized protein n=1 Tax=viral metagenome TaxID=1070528 RepID=A0A6C0LYP3_9ZZZZ
MISTVVNQQMNNKTKLKNKTILNNNATQKKVKTNKQNITNKNDNIAVPRVSPPRVSPPRVSPPRVSPHLLKKQVHKARTIGGFDLTPLISAILLAGIKLSIMQNKQNKNVVEKRKSAKSTKSRTSTKTK